MNQVAKSRKEHGINPDDHVLVKEDFYVRDEVAKDTSNLYLFGENTLNTSGNNLITEYQHPSSDANELEYYNYLNDCFAHNVGIDYTDKCYSNKTQAVIRGLPNALPIYTKKGNRTGEYFQDTYEDYQLYSDYLEIVKFVYLTAVGDELFSAFDKIILPRGGFGTGRAALTKAIAYDLTYELNFPFTRNIVKVIDHPTEKGWYGVVPI